MQQFLDIVLYILAFVVGATVASFVNVLVYRIPRKLDYVRGRSMCPACKRQLTAGDLIPIASYLALGRRCRYCREPISARYPLVELLGGALAVFSCMAFLGAQPSAGLLGASPAPALLAADAAVLGPYAAPLAAVLHFAALCVLLTVTLIDADTMEIPNGLNVALAAIGLLTLLTGPEVSLLSRAVGVVAVSVPLLLITLIKPGAFGGGDIKLMAAAGLLLGWESLLVAFFIGLVIAGTYGIIALVNGRKSRSDHFAFGPALCIGIAVAIFSGRPLINWYLGLM